ncbi:MAG: 50S ribosomal protein L7/L12, partial [Lachnospiraceae bacterium]|nr:50S ribosomal protein L7/L12 [Lachnospiraceae bacterium]
AEEKTEFDIELTEVGPNKVKVIKVVREVTGLGLKEAKDLVDNAPKMVKEAASKEEAEDVKAKLEAEGAKITLK